MKTPSNEEVMADCLREFFISFGASLDPRVWYDLVLEEKQELEEALDSGDRKDILKEMLDLIYVQIGFNFTISGPEQFGLIPADEQAEMMQTITEASDLYDKAVDIMGEGTMFFEAFRRLHNSNLSKLGEDGKPVKREDGKILKGSSYKPPKLEDLI